MGNKKWCYNVLKSEQVEKIVSEDKKSLRVEVYDGSPHLQILLKDKSGQLYFKTLGRLRKDVFQKYNIVPMEHQEGYVNVAHYKFQ